MAKLKYYQSYDRPLREDLIDLQDNIWLGRVSDGTKSGNMRARILVFTTPSVANTEFAVEHGLGEVPEGYFSVGSQTASLVQLDPGGTTWSTERMYLQSPETSKTVAIMVWGSDSA